MDISQSSLDNGSFQSPNIILSKIIQALPNLVSLDISGTNLAGRGVVDNFIRMIDPSDEGLCVIPGLVARIHNPLRFLGLYGTAHRACRRHDIPAKVVSFIKLTFY